MNEPLRFINKNRSDPKNASELKEAQPELKGCKSIDLDELFQFSAARERALQRNAELEYEQPFKNFMPNMVFINHVDSLNGRVIADYLSEQTIRISKPQQSSLEDEEDEVPGESDLAEEKNAAEEQREENFFVVGTVDFMKNPDYIKPESVREILDEEEKDNFLAKILTCGIIIYDISSTLSCHPVQIEEASWVINSIVSQLEHVQKYAPKLFKKYKDCRTFVLISTLLTWAKTKPIDPDDPSLPFTERDYRKRRPHPNYKVHCDFEKKVLKLGEKFPENLRTIVIGSGITYGREEDVLHFLFKMAWLNSPELPLFSPGNNKIPLIHIHALANIVHLIIYDFPKNVRYIVAVEQIPTPLKTIVKLISKKMGNGKIKKVIKEEAFIYPDIKQRNYDMLTANINIIPGYILNMTLKQSSELTFRENIDNVIAEYRTDRNLKPVKIFVHGPPAAGKTHLSKRLADHYKIHHLHAKWVIEQGIQDIKDKIEEIKGKEKKDISREEKDDLFDDDIEEDEDDQEESEDEEVEDLESLTQFLHEIEDNMANNERNRLDEQLLVRLFKRKMLSNACQNQGYVVDSYPKTLTDTKLLYETEEEVEEAEEENDDITKFCNKKILPEFVASLDASDAFLIQRVIQMPQSMVYNSHYEEEEMCRRLFEFRTLNTEDNTCLIFYDDLEVTIKVYNIEDMGDDLELNRTFNSIVQDIGSPRNYDPKAHLDKYFEEKERRNREHLETMKLKSREMIQQRREKMEQWMFLKNQEKEMEEKALALLAMPLRHYLMKYIFPTLTRGLVEVARVRPQDPVDYLAEYLFKENPEGKMFRPDYDNMEDELTEAMKEYEISVYGRAQGSRDNISKNYSADESVVPDVVSNVTDIKEKGSKLTLSSKTSITDWQKDKKEETSSGSCKCLRTTSSSSADTSSNVSLLPTMCTCQRFRSSESSESNSSSSEGSRNSRLGKATSICRCPH